MRLLPGFRTTLRSGGSLWRRAAAWVALTLAVVIAPPLAGSAGAQDEPCDLLLQQWIRDWRKGLPEATLDGALTRLAVLELDGGRVLIARVQRLFAHADVGKTPDLMEQLLNLRTDPADAKAVFELVDSLFPPDVPDMTAARRGLVRATSLDPEYKPGERILEILRAAGPPADPDRLSLLRKKLSFEAVETLMPNGQPAVPGVDGLFNRAAKEAHNKGIGLLYEMHVAASLHKNPVLGRLLHAQFDMSDQGVKLFNKIDHLTEFYAVQVKSKAKPTDLMNLGEGGVSVDDLVKLKDQAELYQPGLKSALVINVQPTPELRAYCLKNDIELLVDEF